MSGRFMMSTTITIFYLLEFSSATGFFFFMDLPGGVSVFLDNGLQTPGVQEKNEKS